VARGERSMKHKPVLLNEAVKLLDPKSGETFIDGTAGSGGHADEIIGKIGNSGKLLLVDWDKINAENLEVKFRGRGNVSVEEGNYADLPGILSKLNFPKADGLLLDLGFSSQQLEERGRGFSFSPSAGEEPLIMTYSDESEPLKDFLMRVSSDELEKIIKEFGEERYARQIAKAITDNRQRVKTNNDLAEIIRSAVPKNYERGRIHPATRTFQALRIYLNKELENLAKIIDELDEILAPGGRIAIISFHSLEDRIVKTKFRELSKKGRLKIITKKPVTAGPEEIASNPRSRSAKLRAAIVI
jgi:16S rRNA (cytosine1402-N4)-methyltransferase